MRCEKCGFEPNPGDQVCINCGAKLSVINAIVPEIEEIKNNEDTNKDNKKLIIMTSLGIIALIIIVFLIIKFLVLKD